MAQFLQYVASGIAIGSLYGLIALGLVLVYKSTQVFNFAHGEMVALSAYLLATFTAMFGSGVIWLNVLSVLIVAVVFGILLQVVLIRHMMDKPLLSTVMVTIGLGMVLRAIILMFWGPNTVSYNKFIPDNVIVLAGVRIAFSDIVITASAAILLVLFGLFFTRTRLGLEMRAVASHLEAAALSGVRTGLAFAIALAVGALLAGVAGVLLANSGAVIAPSLTDLALVAFPAVIIGGISSVTGAVVGGVAVGVLEKIVGGYLGNDAAVAVVYTVLLVVVLLRPQGIFGSKDVVRA